MSSPETPQDAARAFWARPAGQRCLHDWQAAIDSGDFTSAQALEALVERARSQAAVTATAYLEFDADKLTDRLARVDPTQPLAGVPISIKDLFDVQGEVTRAASRVLGGNPPAGRDAPAVQRLRRAGALLTGRTNMSEFAFSGLGLNRHYGTPPIRSMANASPAVRPRAARPRSPSVSPPPRWAAIPAVRSGSRRRSRPDRLQAEPGQRARRRGLPARAEPRLRGPDRAQRRVLRQPLVDSGRAATADAGCHAAAAAAGDRRRRPDERAR